MIHVATPDFDFSKIHLSTPVATTSGSYFTKINYTASEESLYIYTPKCTTKGGVQASGTKRFLDLSFVAANSAIITCPSRRRNIPISCPCSSHAAPMHTAAASNHNVPRLMRIYYQMAEC